VVESVVLIDSRLVGVHVVVVRGSVLIRVGVVVMSDEGLAGGEIMALSHSRLEVRDLRVKRASHLQFHSRTS
jgi:hypothetical protein